jgi:hypothetical protein
MKKKIKVLLFTMLVTMFLSTGYAQPPTPPSDAGHGASGNQAAGNAPIGSGLFILLGLGAAYGGKKIYKMKNEK